MYLRSLSSSRVLTAIGMIVRTWLFKLADGIDVSMNSAAVICTSDDEVESEVCVCVRPVVDGVGVNDVGVGVAVAGEAVVDCDVEPPVSSCLIR